MHEHIHLHSKKMAALKPDNAITTADDSSKDKRYDDLLSSLLDQLATYDSLLEQLQRSFSDGFINLSRANYYNKDTLRGKYGMDYYDESYPGQVFVNIDKGTGKFDIVFKKNIDDEDELITSHESSPSSSEVEMKLRKNRNHEEDEKRQKSVIRDPIQMFGAGLTIPTALRQSQSKFKGSLPTIIGLVNCSRQLNELVEQTKVMRSRQK